MELMLGSLAVALVTLWQSFSYVRKRLSLRLELAGNDPTESPNLSLELGVDPTPQRIQPGSHEHSQEPTGPGPKF